MTDQETGRVAIAAFSGWNDAGEAASGVIEHLLRVWPHRRLGTINAEEYVDFQVNRPMIRTDDRGIRRIDWPDTHVDLLSAPHGEEILVVHGPEPSTRWRSFCAEVLELLARNDATRMVAVGSLLADSPHTRPLPVSSWQELGSNHPIEREAYEGPIGVPAVLARTAVDTGLQTVSLWAQVPHYVSQNPSPKAVLALVRGLQDQLTSTIPLGDLEEDAEAWQRGVDELARTDPDVADYVRRLEEAQDAAGLPDATGDAIAREFEQFLRRRDDEH
ncbi:MAG: PAC2 family protein [Brachybacterium sp.]|nr:PAC2 family protein [Brachybacterium sp.]